MVSQFQDIGARDRFGDQSQPLYDGDRAAPRVYALDATGALILTNPVASFDQLLVSRADEPERDRIQYSQSFDGQKLYAYGSDHRTYAFSATLLDTVLTQPIKPPVGSQAKPWAGRGYRDWVAFFEQYANLWACAKNRHLVQFTYGRRQVYGAVVDMTPTLLASEPHRVDLLLSFYVTHSQPIEF